MDGAAGHFKIGPGQPVERIVGHAVAAHIFRLRVGAERQGACQHRGEDGGGNGPAKGAGGFHLSTLWTAARSLLAGGLRDERGGLFVEIVEHGGEQGFALGRCRPGRIAIAAGAAVVRRIRIRRRQCARCLLFQVGAGFGARHVDQMRRQRQHQRRFQFVGMAAMALLGQLPGHAGIARTFVDPQMLDPLAREPRQGAIDRRQGADPGIEHEQLWASAAENLPRNLAHQRLEGRNRKAAAAGIFDEGGVVAVGQRRPDQRVDFSAIRPASHSA